MAKQKNEWDALRNDNMIKSILGKLESHQDIVLNIKMLLEQNSEQELVNLIAIVATTPSEKKPIDRLFRDGMSLPDVWPRNPLGQFDLIVLVEDPLLVTCLNFCEGKAHLDLLENDAVRQKLKEKGFSNGIIVKRAVKHFSRDLRWLFSPDISEPVADVFLKFFSVPGDEPSRKHSPQKPGVDDGPDDIDPPPPRTSPFLVEDLAEGFEIQANPEYDEDGWPINLTVTCAYADGSRRPSWDKYDFRLEDLSFDHEGCQIATRKDNKIRAHDCHPNCRISVTGFDTRRELDTTIRWDKDAQED